MIQVDVFRNRGRIERVIVEGHAHFDEPGRDIVCAAVSSITIGLVNATEKLLGVRVYEADESAGRIECRIPELESDAAERVQLLMKAMVHSLAEIAEAYPDHVRIQNREARQG
jgi:uncharacterized protein YsxB (DUF464 family)